MRNDKERKKKQTKLIKLIKGCLKQKRLLSRVFKKEFKNPLGVFNLFLFCLLKPVRFVVISYGFLGGINCNEQG